MANINALKKIAWDENGEEFGRRPAGVGTFDQNALVKAWPFGDGGWVSHGLNVNSRPADSSSYFAKLLENAKKDPRNGSGGGAVEVGGDKIGRGTKALDDLKAVAPMAFQGRQNKSQITNDDLEKIRFDQAKRVASGLARPGTVENEELRTALEEAGRNNQQSFIRTKSVPLQNPLQNPKIRELFNRIKLSPEQKKALPAIFGSMASAYSPKSSVKKAQDEGGKGIWDSVLSKINDVRSWYENPDNASFRPLVNAGIGAIGLGALNKLLGGSFGRGAALGGIGGAVTGVDWKALSDALGTKATESAQNMANRQNARTGLAIHVR